MTDNPYLQWPVFRRSVVAAFQRSLTSSVGGLRKTNLRVRHHIGRAGYGDTAIEFRGDSRQSVLGTGKHMIFGWDIDVPSAQRPSEGRTNIAVFREYRSLLRGASLYFVPFNTWRAEGTGHTSREAGQAYVDRSSGRSRLGRPHEWP